MAKQKDTLVNLQAAQIASQVANMAAQLDFQKERFKLLEMPQFAASSQMDIDKFAWQKAQDTWQKAFQEASINGTYNGQPTTEWLTQQAQMTGVINGQQTIQGKLTDAQIAQMSASILNTQKLTDLEYQKFGFQREQYDSDHKMALEKQQADLTGYINGLPTFQREQWEASQGQAMEQLLSTLRGPENAFVQLRVLQGMPDGLRAMTQKWAGIKQGAAYGTATGAPPSAANAGAAGLLSAYTPPGGTPATATAALPAGTVPVGTFPATTAAATQAAQAANTATPAPGVAAPVYTPPGYTVDPAGSQAAVGAYNYQPTETGGTQVYPPGVVAPVTATQVSTSVPVDHATQQSMTQQALVPQTADYVLPSQINAKQYNQSTGYEQALGWAGYEDQGWDKSVAQDLFKKSLPKYGVSSTTPAQGKVAL